jgi:hypothetical protein
LFHLQFFVKIASKIAVQSSGKIAGKIASKIAGQSSGKITGKIAG